MCKAEYAKAVDKLVFPGLQGGPLMHVIAAKAVAFKEALSPQFNAISAASPGQCESLGAGSVDRGYKIVSGGTDTHLMLAESCEQGDHRKRGGCRAGCSRHYRQ